MLLAFVIFPIVPAPFGGRPEHAIIQLCRQIKRSARKGSSPANIWTANEPRKAKPSQKHVHRNPKPYNRTRIPRAAIVVRISAKRDTDRSQRTVCGSVVDFAWGTRSFQREASILCAEWRVMMVITRVMVAAWRASGSIKWITIDKSTRPWGVLPPYA